MQNTVQSKRVITNTTLIIYGILAYITTLPQLSYLTLIRALYSGSITGDVPVQFGFIYLPLNILSYVITIVLAIVIYSRVKPSVHRSQLFNMLFMVYLITLILGFILFFIHNLLFFVGSNMGYELFLLINRLYAMATLVLLVSTLLVFIIGLIGIVHPQFSNISVILGTIYILLIILTKILSNLNVASSIDQHFRMMINILYLEQLNILVAVFFLASLKTHKINEEKNVNDVFSSDFSY
ncbi:hypothetical protein [Liberiplasma polymorphum]|uniref:hypothetical protein n=1 Tax=Liberiplasma polymorphum TaxID=3374570 RepID=UPI003772CD60